MKMCYDGPRGRVHVVTAGCRFCACGEKEVSTEDKIHAYFQRKSAKGARARAEIKRRLAEEKAL